LNGEMVTMPDDIVAYLQKFRPEILHQFPEVTSERAKEHLARLINRLEILLGEEPSQQPLDERDFSFVADQDLREVLKLDFIEAQKSFAAEVYKACGLLCGGLIEGMLLDIVKRSSEQPVEEDRVSMTNLINLSSKLGLVGDRALRFAKGARDTRDTVHPRAEVRQGSRVSREEALMLLELVKLIYNDLVTRFSKDRKQ